MGSQIIEQKEKFSWKKISNWGRQHIWEIASILVAIIGLILFMMHRNYDVSKPIDGSLWGQFGDYVGGIVGSIIAYISVKLLSENLREQKTANEYLKDSNDNAKKVMELEQFDRTFSTLLNMYGTSQDELTKIDNEIESFLSFKCSKKEYNEAVKEAVIQYEVFYCNNRQVLAPYLRVLFQLLQMIADSSMNKDIQIKYAKILRAQLTDKELLILRYNAMTSYGKKMQFYLNYFNILKHLPILQLVEFNSLLPCGMTDNDSTLFDTVFISARKHIIKVFNSEFAPDSDVDVKQISIKGHNLKITTPLKDKKTFRINFIYNKKSRNTEITTLSDNDIKMILKNYVKEIVVYMTFKEYQTEDKIIIESDIEEAKGTKQHTIWVEVSHKENYQLVLSQRQLSKPDIS